MTQTEKKQLIIFVLVSYGITYIMGLLMWFFYGKGADFNVFPIAQMLYPAAGVMLAYLITAKGDKNLPRILFIFYLLLTAVMVLCAAGSVFLPVSRSLEAVAVSNWVIMIGSVIFWILLLESGREKRRAYGLSGRNWGKSFLLILVFLVLYCLRMVVSNILAGRAGELAEIMTDPVTWLNLLIILLNFFLSAMVFFGEEYGWRYYLQPIMQKRFGLRGGVLLLGVVWGLWHLPLNFFYYNAPDMGVVSCVGQQITCIFIGIFLAYAYMKTENIWVPVIVHFLNNNLILIFAGEFSTDAIQNQTIYWGDLIPSLILNLAVFGWFLFLKPFRKRREGELPSQDANKNICQ